MEQTSGSEHLLVALADAWAAVERRLNGQLGSICGISLAEYRMLRALATAPGSKASRADLARAVSVTPSGVTRGLRPLERLGIVETVKNERDARLALAALTSAGDELFSNATTVVRDAMSVIEEQTPRANAMGTELVSVLSELARV